MKENRTLREQLEAIYEPTPEAFSRRVRDTLEIIRAKGAKSAVSRSIHWGAALLAALLLLSAAGVAAKLGGVFDFMTHTEAKNWVLDEAKDLLHENASEARIGDCVIGIREWVCDGERLYVCLSVADPALEAERRGAPGDDLGRPAGCGLRYAPRRMELSQGELIGGMTWDYMWGDEAESELLYVLEQRIANTPDAFSVRIPVTCPAGSGSVSFDVTRADFGRVRDFLPSPVMETEEYAAQITRFRATALRTYVSLSLTFAEGVDGERRDEIANGYLCGLLVPEGKLDAAAGSGEEIAYGTLCEWTKDRDGCVITLEGNPREDYPEKALMCPRWGVEDVEWEGLCPLSMEGAIVMNVKEAK